MPPLIVFYSLTGTTRLLAERLAGALGGADLAAIGCRRYRPGRWIFVRGGGDATFGLLPPLESAPDPAGRDFLLLGGPVWAGRPAPPVLAWLARRPALPARTGLFLCSGAGGDQAPAFDRLIRRMAAPPVARLSLAEAEVRSDGGGAQIAAFVAALAA